MNIYERMRPAASKNPNWRDWIDSYKYVAYDPITHLRTTPAPSLSKLLDLELMRHPDYLEDAKPIEHKLLLTVDDLSQLPEKYPEYFI